MRARGPRYAAAVLIAGLSVLGAAPAGGHPAHRTEPVDVNDSGYAPADVTIRVGSSVQWTWRGIFQHTVTADDGSFDSGGKQSGTFTWIFTKVGEFPYHSTQGSAMSGIVRVLPLPGVAPRIRRLRVSSGSHPKARFRLNKRADIIGRAELRQGGQWRTDATFFKSAREGRNRVPLPDDRLDPGRHRFVLLAYDRYNRSDKARARFRFG